MMKKTPILLSSLLIGGLLGAEEVEAPHELLWANSVGGNYGRNNLQFKDLTTGASDFIKWIPYSILSFNEAYGTLGIWDALEAEGVIVHGAKLNHNVNGGSTLVLGAQGIRMLDNGGKLSIAHYYSSPKWTDNPDPRLRLTASCVWAGENATGRSAVSIGQINVYRESHEWSYVKADADCESLTIRGRLYAMFYSELNDFSPTDVTIESPACLLLVKGNETEGQLHAKSVTFRGDGEAAIFGGYSPQVDLYNNTVLRLLPVVSPANLSDKVTLVDGADFTFNMVNYRLPSVSVTGSGVSTWSGEALMIDIPEATVDIAEGSRVEVAVPLGAGTEGNRLAVTGAGTLGLSVSGGTDLVLDVGPDATVEIADGVIFGGSIVGSGTLRLAPGAHVTITDYANFTGTLDLNGGEIAANDMLYVTDTPVTAELIKVEQGQRLMVAGNGLTAATTVWMNGGEMLFLRDCTVSATVTQDVSSVYRVASSELAVTFAGPVVLSGPAVDVNSERNRARFSGGSLHFTGGLFTRRLVDIVHFLAGSVEFSQTPSDIGGEFLVQYSDTTANCSTLTNLTIRGTTVTCAEPKIGADVSSRAFVFSPGGKSVFSIVEGGVLKLGGSKCLNLATYSSSDVTLLIDNGSLITPGWGSTEVVSNPNSSLLIDFRSGLMSFGRPINRINIYSNTRFDFQWKGGTIRAANEHYIKNFYGNFFSCTGNALKAEDLRQSFQILGETCVLEVAPFKTADKFGNYIETSALTTSEGKPVKGAFWTGSPEAKMTIRCGGEGYCGVRLNHLVPNGMKLQLDDNADVIIGAVTNALDFSEIIVNTTTAKVTATPGADLATVPSPTVGTLRIAAGGAWSASLLDMFGAFRPTFTNVAFDDGSRWFIPADANAKLAVPGTLSLLGTVRYQYEGATTGSRVIATTEGGVMLAEDADWQPVTGPRRKLSVQKSGKDLVSMPFGLVLIMR